MEDLRQAAHKDQVVVTARYLGLNERRSGERPTNRRCTRDLDVVGVVRFAPVLRRGRVYRLTFVKSAGLAVREPGLLKGRPLVLTLVAVNPP
jgi:hypothetical protein